MNMNAYMIFDVMYYIPNDWYIKAEKKWPSSSDDISKCIFLNENVWISIISLMFVPWGPINNLTALVQIMA